MADEDGAVRLKRGMASILDELESLYAEGKIGAVSIAIALRSGDVRHLTAYDNGFRIVLIGAAAIAQREVVENAARGSGSGELAHPGTDAVARAPSTSGRDVLMDFDWAALQRVRKSGLDY